MSEKIRVSVMPESLTSTIGEAVEISATLKNLGQSIDQFSVSIEGLDAGWYTLPVSSVALFPNDEDNLKIIITVPDNPEVNAGSYPFTIKVVSQADSSETTAVPVTLELSALPELELSITPACVTGRRGTYQVSINNPDGRDAHLYLEATDTQGSLRYFLKPEEITVRGGTQTHSTLDVSPGWMAFFGGEKTIDFQVTATSPELNDGKSINGQFVRVPWYRIFSGLRLSRVREIDGRLARMPWYQSLRRLRFPRIHLPWLEKPPEITAFNAQTDDKIEYKLTWSVKRTKDVQLNGESVEKHDSLVLVPSAITNYVLTAGNKHGRVSKTIEVQPRQVPEARTSDRISASLSSTELKLQAGGIPETVTLQLQNLSEIVDKLVVEVEGLDDDWYSRSASSIALMPQATEQVQITFSPPKKRGVKARTYAFAVSVRSQSNPEEAAIITGNIEVLPLVEYKMKIAPYRVTTKSKGKFRVVLANTGMSDAKVYFDATDLDEGLLFKFGREEQIVSAWETVEVPMIAKPKKGSKVGERKRYDITVTTTGEDGVAQTANCEMNHRPFMTSWRPVWRIVKALIIIGIIGTGVYYLLRLGGGWSQLIRSPQTWVDTLVRTVEGWFFK